MADPKIDNIEDLLLALGATAAHREFNDKLRSIIAEGRDVAESEGSASGDLTLKLSFAFEGRNGKTTVRYSVTGKEPQRPRETTVLFALKDGTFSARDPRQPELPSVRSVPAREVREVGSTQTVKEIK